MLYFELQVAHLILLALAHRILEGRICGPKLYVFGCDPKIEGGIAHTHTIIDDVDVEVLYFDDDHFIEEMFQELLDFTLM